MKKIVRKHGEKVNFVDKKYVKMSKKLCKLQIKTLKMWKKFGIIPFKADKTRDHCP